MNDSIQPLNSNPPQNNSGRWMLIFLFVFFAVPILLVVLMHKYEVRPKGASNGELIVPAVALTIPSEMLDSEARKLDKKVWNDKWNMVYLAKNCESTCEAKLLEVRKLHASLAKEIERVQRVLITENTEVSALQKKYPDLIIMHQPTSAVTALSQQFASKDGSVKPGLYLVDPLGNLMMHYLDDTPPKSIRADMLRLLKYSWAG